jgi:large subunit ribosomal protein LP2
MRYLAAFALAFLGGKANPSEADLKKILQAAGADVDDSKVKAVVEALKGKSVSDVITENLEQLGKIPTGAGIAASAAPTTEKVVAVAVEEEEEEEDEEMGMDMFGF